MREPVSIWCIVAIRLDPRYVDVEQPPGTKNSKQFLDRGVRRLAVLQYCVAHDCVERVRRDRKKVQVSVACNSWLPLDVDVYTAGQ
jgi:hypothetical protein